MNYGHGFISQEILAAFNQTLLGDPLRLEDVEVTWDAYRGEARLILIEVVDRANPDNNQCWIVERRKVIKYIEDWRILYGRQREYYTCRQYPGELFRGFHGRDGNLWKDAFQGWWSRDNPPREIDPEDMIDCCWTVGNFDPTSLYPAEDSSV